MDARLGDDDLLQRLRDVYDRRRAEVREQWSRDLPFEELLFDRWERAATLGFGAGTSIYHSAYVYGDVRVGRDTWIGPGVLLDGSGSLTIGDGCDISAGVQIYTHDTVRRVLSDGRAAIDHAPVTIADRCHLGAGAIVLGGVRIGSHTVVGAGAVVTRSLPERVVAAGVPCRVIGQVEVSDAGEVSLRYD